MARVFYGDISATWIVTALFVLNTIVTSKDTSTETTSPLNASTQTSTRQFEVVDNAISLSSLSLLNRYISNYLFWDFTVNQSKQFTLKSLEHNIQQGSNGVEYIAPWVVNFPIKDFNETKIWNVVKKIVKNRTQTDLYLREVRTVVTWRTDQIFTQKCEDENEIVVFIHLNKQWQKNWYGEIILYGESEITPFHRKPGRIVVAQCPNKYLLKPPSMDTKQAVKSLIIKMTPSVKIHNEACLNESVNTDDFYARLAMNDEYFPTNNDVSSNMTFDPKEYLTKHYSVDGKRNIYIFDNVFENSKIEALAEFINVNITYQESVPEDYSDNVYWASGYNIHVFTKSVIWKTAQTLIKYATGRSDFVPYDVTCNLIRTSDHSQIHQDCAHSNDEFTFLLYINQDWQVEYYGETVFFDDNFEPIMAVRPRYGRILIFSCNIPHSARPPSPLINGARYTFVAKVSIQDRFKSMDGLHDDSLTLTEFLEDMADDISDLDRGKVIDLINLANQGTANKKDVQHYIKMFEDKEKLNIANQI